ncbi:hypothetical protein PAP_02900 [Palaeococcus pacificus DY20341]|uniref:Prenyltransferase alpha-alpha toroid domain-containing protein n=1 Tax=Palaeococcus pacificus DY20341 TaxID=1343739 RepID=A0A075LQK0_9EURY|nr:prenyltransferase/squalene oxidase repeat-containing protein [Palaeococcus pacificus]AIF69000.1 hypothetical protein PAP_02900 [Palaeococcus pacificus DY20341]
MGSELHELKRYINVDALLRYVEERRHEDGGYCFVSLLAETNINDTYHAVKIYDLLGLDVPNKDETVEFLYNSIKPQQATVALAMAVEGLAILGAKDLAKEKLGLLFEKYNPIEGKFAVGLGGSEEFGASTPLEATYWVLKALSALDYELDDEVKNSIKEFINGFKKREGYGVKQPTTTMTYHALSSLSRLGFEVQKTNLFKECEVYGGFTEVPLSLPPYLEPTFYAIFGLELIGDAPTYIRAHINFIRALQNSNGGFRRSLEMGISNFQNSYRALKSLVKLLKSDWEVK